MVAIEKSPKKKPIERKPLPGVEPGVWLWFLAMHLLAILNFIRVHLYRNATGANKNLFKGKNDSK